MAGAGVITMLDAFARETSLFAAVWFLIGGIDDLAVDLLFAARLAKRGLARRGAAVTADALPDPEERIAIFVPAWDEAAVIGAMLRTMLARFAQADCRVYVGTYPNDPATARAVAEVARIDARVRLVIGAAPGPTTKADCLNSLWRALLRDEAVEVPVAAVALHDAEDVVHAAELRLFAHFLRRCDAVQIPVLPLRDPRSRLVSGHYCDEFAEAHGKTLVVRQALRAALPFAGVGCAIRRDMLGRIAARRGGVPFDADSLTEDYELGLTVAALGGRTILAQVAERPGGRPVAVRAYFPATLDAAVRQKARWFAGIALAGWDRTGWAAGGGAGEHWMRMRDRRATLAMPVFAVAYVALLAWGMTLAAHAWLASPPPPLAPMLAALLAANAALLGWRLGMRALCVRHAYGWREALWSLPRLIVANAIALLAARRALLLYLAMLATGATVWEKTAHHFPEDPERATG